jgi:hypothetical protein
MIGVAENFHALLGDLAIERVHAADLIRVHGLAPVPVGCEDQRYAGRLRAGLERSVEPLRRLTCVGFKTEDFLAEAFRRVIGLRARTKFFVEGVNLGLLCPDQIVCV